MLSRILRPIVNDNGSLLPFATAVITNRVDSVLSTLWSDRDASTVLSTVGAATANIRGYLDVFLMPGDYSISITSADGLFTGDEEIFLPPKSLEISDATTSRTLSAIDAGNFITFTSASAIQVDLQDDSSFFFPTNTIIYLRQSGAGQITVVPETSVTLEPPADGSLLSAGDGGTFSLRKRSANNWQMLGHSEAA